MYSLQIKNYINKLEKPPEPIQLDLVLEGGAFNGSYEYGVLILLKELEKQQYIKINRISGASIGSILGFCYLVDRLELYVECFNIVKESLKETGTLIRCKELIQKEIHNLDNDVIKSISKNRLYITYYNVNDKVQNVQSSYCSKDDFINGIIKSCYIPFIFDNSITVNLENINYIDGGQPFIFQSRCKDDRKILYLSINQISKLRHIFSLKDGNCHHSRILEGLLDAMQFFKYNKPTNICSYVNDWGIHDYGVIRLKQLGLLLFVYVINIFTQCATILYPFVKDSVLYSIITSVLQSFLNDIIILYCF